MRIKRGYKARRRRNKVLKLAKGFRGGRSKLYRTAADAVDKALGYAYRDRRVRKREFRKLWITRINAASKMNDLSYSKLIHGLNWPTSSLIERFLPSWLFPILRASLRSPQRLRLSFSLLKKKGGDCCGKNDTRN